jgi:hypothetical protein
MPFGRLNTPVYKASYDGGTGFTVSPRRRLKHLSREVGITGHSFKEGTMLKFNFGLEVNLAHYFALTLGLSYQGEVALSWADLLKLLLHKLINQPLADKKLPQNQDRCEQDETSPRL